MARETLFNRNGTEIGRHSSGENEVSIFLKKENKGHLAWRGKG